VRVTIQRVGGMLPTLRPSVAHELDTLDEPTRQALQHFIMTHGRARSAAHPEAMNYVFHLEDAGAAPRTVSAPFSAIPESLRGLLPDPRSGQQ
jgi:hypothetical protein